MKRRGIVLGAVAYLCALGCDEDEVRTLKPTMELAPLSLDFGQVVIGDAKVELITISNKGDGPLSIVRFEAGEGQDFQITIESRTVPPGGSTEARVRFQPLSVGEQTGSLLIAGEGVEARVIALRGEGVSEALSVEPARVDFGRVLLGATAERSATITNRLDRAIELRLERGAGLVTCTGGQGGPFCVRSGETIALSPGQSEVLRFDFAPAAEGDEHARLTLIPCEGCAETRIELTGIGALSALECTPRLLSFGTVLPGRCVTREVRCSNGTDLPVDLISWTLEQPSDPSFALGTMPGGTVLPGEELRQEVTYCPAATGDHRGRMQVRTEPRGELVVPLEGSGGGPELVVVPEQLAFGNTALVAPKRRSLVISNAGFSDLVITGLQISDPLAGFNVLGTVAPMRPGEARTLVVEFAPAVAGDAFAELTIESNDPGRTPLAIPLSGLGVALAPCMAQVRPESLSFGVVAPERFLRRAVEVVNQGADACLLYDAAMAEGSSDAFRIDGVLPEMIAAGASELIFVEFAPLSAGTHMGSMELTLSTPSGSAAVALSGIAAGGDLLVVPAELRFGAVGVDCASRTFEIRVHNLASVSTPVRAIDLIAPAGGFEVTDLPMPLPASPVNLAPGASFVFRATFRPEELGPFAGAIVLQSTLAGQPAEYVVPLEGEGATDPTQRDSFVQLGASMADILFVVDNSCSMGDEQLSLANNLAAFIAYANQEAVDYNIAITTLDNAVPGFGLFVPVNGPPADRVITRATLPSPEAAFQRNANVGAVGPGPEMGMQAIFEALSEPNLSSHNFGFLRREAVLSIIVVSDQPDLSPLNDNFYYAFLQSIKGANNESALTFSAIVGDAPTGCMGPGGTADQGIRYIDMANRTGGVVQSICAQNWATSLEELSSIAFGFRTRFFLSGVPVLSSLEVRVNGVPVRTGPGSWTYDMASNAIQFTTLATPEPGAMIDVSYAIACL